jgi:hydrogenase maturation protease
MPRGAHRILVIGIGNPDRGDDGVGRAVASHLKRSAPAGTSVVESDGNIADLLDKMEGWGKVIIVDASQSGAAPGTVRRIDVSDRPLPPDAFGASTHGLGLAQAVDLARILGNLPLHCIVFAVEGASFAIGATLSLEVEAAVAAVAELIRAEIDLFAASVELSDA